MHCKNGRSRSVRRRHKRFRNVPENVAVPAFYPYEPGIGRAVPV